MENHPSPFDAREVLGALQESRSTRLDVAERPLRSVDELINREIAWGSPVDAASRRLGVARDLQDRLALYAGFSDFVKGLLCSVILTALVIYVLHALSNTVVIIWWRLVIVFVVGVIVLMQLNMINIRITRDFANQKVADYISYLKNTKKYVQRSSSNGANLFYDLALEAKERSCWKLRFARSDATDDLCELFKAFAFWRR
jgi:hypothetical protein